MYPFNVMQDLREAFPDPALREAGERRSRVNVSRTAWATAPGVFEDWMIAEEPKRESVRAYLSYLRRARAHFDEVGRKMGYWNPAATHSLGHDKWSVGWAGANMLSMAAYLYILRSYDVSGCVLECGAFKGASTACLSWVCHELGLTLYSADSFAGLPATEGHYGAGDFCGSLEEVTENVNQCGRPECVHYIKGWYSESLKDFNRDILLLWVDVDLEQSTTDVLENVFRFLNTNGVIFSDGFVEGKDYADHKIKASGGEPGGFRRFFGPYRIYYREVNKFFRFLGARQIGYQVVNGAAKGLALIVPNVREGETVLFRAESFNHLVALL
jgi:hypothetical protein